METVHILTIATAILSFPGCDRTQIQLQPFQMSTLLFKIPKTTYNFYF